MNVLIGGTLNKYSSYITKAAYELILLLEKKTIFSINLQSEKQKA